MTTPVSGDLAAHPAGRRARAALRAHARMIVGSLAVLLLFNHASDWVFGEAIPHDRTIGDALFFSFGVTGVLSVVRLIWPREADSRRWRKGTPRLIAFAVTVAEMFLTLAAVMCLGLAQPAADVALAVIAVGLSETWLLADRYEAEPEPPDRFDVPWFLPEIPDWARRVIISAAWCAAGIVVAYWTARPGPVAVPVSDVLATYAIGLGGGVLAVGGVALRAHDRHSWRSWRSWVRPAAWVLGVALLGAGVRIGLHGLLPWPSVAGLNVVAVVALAVAGAFERDAQTPGPHMNGVPQ